MAIDGSSYTDYFSGEIPPYDSALTIMAWIYPFSFSSWNCLIHGVTGAGGDYWYHGFYNSRMYQEWGPAQNCSTLLSTNRWYHVTYAKDAGTGTVHAPAYLNGNVEVNSSVIPGDAQGELRFKTDGGTWQEWFYGLVCSIKIWTAKLSPQQVQMEMQSYSPIREKDIWLWSPVLPGADRNRDYSPNQRHWTENGTLTDRPGVLLPHDSKLAVPKRRWPFSHASLGAR